MIVSTHETKKGQGHKHIMEKNPYKRNHHDHIHKEG